MPTQPTQNYPQQIADYNRPQPTTQTPEFSLSEALNALMTSIQQTQEFLGTQDNNVDKNIVKRINDLEVTTSSKQDTLIPGEAIMIDPISKIISSPAASDEFRGTVMPDGITTQVTEDGVITAIAAASVSPWGSLIGNINDQKDLITQLNSKENSENKTSTISSTPNNERFPTEKAVHEQLIVKADLVDGLVPVEQLPSYVDEVIELIGVSDNAPEECVTNDMYFNTVIKLLFIATSTNTWSESGLVPETGKIYVDISSLNSYTYRWTGDEMINITNPLDYASKEEAEAGENNTKVMTPLRTIESYKQQYFVGWQQISTDAEVRDYDVTLRIGKISFEGIDLTTVSIEDKLKLIQDSSIINCIVVSTDITNGILSVFIEPNKSLRLGSVRDVCLYHVNPPGFPKRFQYAEPLLVPTLLNGFVTAKDSVTPWMPDPVYYLEGNTVILMGSVKNSVPFSEAEIVFKPQERYLLDLSGALYFDKGSYNVIVDGGGISIHTKGSTFPTGIVFNLDGVVYRGRA